MSAILSIADLRGGDGEFSSSLSSVTSIVFRILKLLEPSWTTTDFFLLPDFVLLWLVASDFLDSLLTEGTWLSVLPCLGSAGVLEGEAPDLLLSILPYLAF